MVGVPGKSKGCNTCRKRKIGCDQARPACGQCQRTGRVCGGYERPTRWLHQFAAEYGPKVPDTAEVVLNQAEPQATVSKPLLEPSGSFIHQLHKHGKVNAAQVQLCVSNPRVPGIISLEHLQYNQALRNFLSCSLPDQAKEDVPLLWLCSLSDITTDAYVLQLAVSALSYGWAGHVEESDQLIDRARSIYVYALRRLHKTLSDNPATHSDTTLATVQCLALYEIFETGAEFGSGWLAHLSGIEAIIKSRGPQRHVAGVGHSMFMYFRTICIFKSMIQRKATFLADDQWRHVPWTMHTKNAFHRYLDLTAEVPAMLERADSFLEQWATSSAQDCLIYLRDCVSMLARLQASATELEISSPIDPSTISTTMAGLRSSDAIGKPHHVLQKQVRYHGSSGRRQCQHCYPSKTPHDLGTSFDVLQRSRFMYTSWGVQLVIYLSIYENVRLRNYLESWTDSDQSLVVLSRSQGTQIAEKAAMWADFCTQNAWQSFGPIFGVFAMETIVKWFQLDKEYEIGYHKTSSTSLQPPAAPNSFDESRRYSHQSELDECLALLDRLPGAKNWG